MQAGEFRNDLYHRFAVVKLEVPALCERRDDIIPMAKHFLVEYSQKFKKSFTSISADAQKALEAYDWPGNVRELQNVIERGVITARQGRLNLDHALPGHMNSTNFAKQTPPENGVKTIRQLQQQERENLLLALKISQWQIGGKKGAAQLVGMPPTTFQSRMKAMGIKRPH